MKDEDFDNFMAELSNLNLGGNVSRQAYMLIKLVYQPIMQVNGTLQEILRALAGLKEDTDFIMKSHRIE